MGNPDEQVLVVPRDAIVPGEGWLGIRRDGFDAALDVVGREGRFMRRGDAEEDPSFKQVIPYLVLRDGETWFLMRRTTAFTPVGLLNDDTTPVGAVHIGFVYAADAAGRPVAIRETEKLTGHFATRPEVEAVLEAMETWSRLAFEALTA